MSAPLRGMGVLEVLYRKGGGLKGVLLNEPDLHNKITLIEFKEAAIKFFSLKSNVTVSQAFEEKKKHLVKSVILVSI